MDGSFFIQSYPIREQTNCRRQRGERTCSNYVETQSHILQKEKKEAIKVLSETIAHMIGEDIEILDSDDDYQPLPFVNQIVACVDRNSTMKKPIIYLGIVVRVKTSTRSVILAELESLR